MSTALQYPTSDAGGGGGTPDAHSTSHKNGGADEVATATPAANAIPKAGSGGTLAAGWIPAGADSSALHGTVASEIHALTNKATPVDADEIVGEDSAAGAWSKIRVAMSAVATYVISKFLAGTSQLAGLTADASPASTALFMFEKPTGELRKVTRAELATALGVVAGTEVTLASGDLSAVSELDLTSISGSYNSLVLYLYVKGSTTSQNLGLQFNGDTTAANYHYSLWGLSNGVGQQAEAAASQQIGIVAGSDYLSGAYCYHKIEIPLYAVNGNPKLAYADVETAVSASNIVHYHISNQWTGTAPVTRVRTFPLSGTMTGTYRLVGRS